MRRDENGKREEKRGEGRGNRNTAGEKKKAKEKWKNGWILKTKEKEEGYDTIRYKRHCFPG